MHMLPNQARLRSQVTKYVIERATARQALRYRLIAVFAVVAVLAFDVQTPASQEAAAPTRPVGTMSDLMVKMIYPTSDAIFYIETRTPKTDAEWNELQAKTLTLAESANLLMMPGRARDQERWMADAKLMLDAGIAAYAAAKKKDVAALVDLNDAVYQSCVVCHQHYRRNYGRRP
jgi:hypothetical protein